MWKSITSLLAISLLTSCTNYQAESFTVNSVDVYAAESHVSSQVQVAPLSADSPGQNSIFCRGLNKAVYLPNKTTFVHYIEDALKSTLIQANRYNEQATNQLRGTITLVDFNTTAGRWHLVGKFNINNSIPVTIDGVYSFPSAWDNELACQNAAAAFNQAVGNFIHDIFAEPKLQSALKNTV